MKYWGMGMLVALATLLLAGAPAEASASTAAQRAVRQAVENRYAPASIAVRCHHRVCEVAFRQGSTTCMDTHVRVTRKRHVRGLNPRCTVNSAPAASGDTAPPPPPATDVVAPPPAQGDAAPATSGPPALPGGPPPPPPARAAGSSLAHTSSNGWEWAGWESPFQWSDYPGYWFAVAVWHDQRACEPYYADYRGVYYYDGSQWQFWYGFWQNWWFGDTYSTDPCNI
jgi:hypothetical protein